MLKARSKTRFNINCSLLWSMRTVFFASCPDLQSPHIGFQCNLKNLRYAVPEIVKVKQTLFLWRENGRPREHTLRHPNDGGYLYLATDSSPWWWANRNTPCIVLQEIKSLLLRLTLFQSKLVWYNMDPIMLETGHTTISRSLCTSSEGI